MFIHLPCAADRTPVEFHARKGSVETGGCACGIMISEMRFFRENKKAASLARAVGCK